MDHFRRDTTDTGIPFVWPLKERRFRRSSRISLADRAKRKKARAGSAQARSSVEHHPPFDQLGDLRIIGDENHRPGLLFRTESRSEERRVGKECRSRWS